MGGFALVAAAAISAGASAYSTYNSSGLRRKDIRRLNQLSFNFSDFPGSAGIDAYVMQNMLGMGLGLNSIRNEFVFSRVEQLQGAKWRRRLQTEVDSANRAIARGDDAGARAIASNINWRLGRNYKHSRAQAPATASIVGGELVFKVNDPTWTAFERAYEDSGVDPNAIFSQRLQAQESIVNFTRGLESIIGAEGIAGLIKAKNDQLNANLDERVAEAKQQIIADASRMRIDPTGRLREMDERVLLLKQKIDTEDAIRSATSLASGVAQATSQGIGALKAGLTPVGPLKAPAGQIDPQIAGQLAIARAGADQARSAGLSNIFGGIAQGLFTAGGDRLSSGTTTGAETSNSLQNQLGLYQNYGGSSFSSRQTRNYWENR